MYKDLEVSQKEAEELFNLTETKFEEEKQFLLEAKLKIETLNEYKVKYEVKMCIVHNISLL